MIVRPPRYRVNIETATENQFKVKVEEDLSDHILAVGERYQNSDVKCVPAATLGERSSGVLRKFIKILLYNFLSTTFFSSNTIYSSRSQQWHTISNKTP